MTDVDWLTKEVQSVDDDWLHPDKSTYTPAQYSLRYYWRGLRGRLLDGFESREAVLLWQHAVAVCLLGQVPDDWHSKLLNIRNRWGTAALLANPSDRQHITAHPPADAECVSYRREILKNNLTPAFRRAMMNINQQDTERTEDPLTVEDVENQAFVAMRPRAHEKASTQRRLLEQALGRSDDAHITTPADVDDWMGDLIWSTSGFVPDTIVEDMTNPFCEWQTLLMEDSGVNLQFRLANDVLPSMNAAIRDACQRSEEHEQDSSDPAGPMEVGG